MFFTLKDSTPVNQWSGKIKTSLPIEERSFAIEYITVWIPPIDGGKFCVII